MDFLDYYIEFNNIFKKWLIAQSVCDVLFVVLAVLCVIAGKMITFAFAFILYIFAEIIVIYKIFGTAKNMWAYLTLRSRYRTAQANHKESELEKLETEIIEYMKKDTAD